MPGWHVDAVLLTDTQQKNHGDCFPSIIDEVGRINNASGGSITSTTKLDSASVNAAIEGADHVIMVVDNARDGGGEGHDRCVLFKPL